MNSIDVMLIKYGNKLVIRQLNHLQLPAEFTVEDVSTITAESFQPIFGDIDLHTREQCSALLREFRDCISYSICDLGKTSAAELTIKCLTEEPIVYRPCRMPLKEKEILRDIIAELLSNGTVREIDNMT